jgi:hypothetical protein
MAKFKAYPGFRFAALRKANPLSATWHSSVQRGTAKECCGLSSAKAFNGQVMEI